MGLTPVEGGEGGTVTVQVEEKFQCDQCDALLSTKDSLYVHRSKKHRNRAPLPCNVCGKPFPDKWRLERHEKSHK